MTKTYENTLKQVIISILGASDDIDYNISNELKRRWLEKRNHEKEKNDGFLFEKRILFYADFIDLRTIVEKNWNAFEKVFKNKDRFFVFFDEVYQFKNTLNLGNSLTKSQEELLSGITADLKNSFTIFSNKNNNTNDYFIAINKVSDNLGTTWFSNNSDSPNKPTLTVGDDYELLIEANDPKDREIEYEVYHFAGSLRIKQESNRFIFKITADLIGLNTMLVVKAYTPKSEYKNERSIKIFLTVLTK